MSGLARSSLLTLLLAATTLSLAGTAQAQRAVDLGAADPFAVLAGTAVTNTGPTAVTGDLGVSPGATVTGFPPGTVSGAIHAGDSAAAQAQAALAAAYAAASQPVSATIPAQLGGQALPPGVYDSPTGDFLVNGTLTLDGQGDGDAIFIFRASGDLTTGGGSDVRAIRSAQACNVFWQVGGSAMLGAASTFIGNVLAQDSIAAGAAAAVDGRLLARTGAVDLDSNAIVRADCDRAGPRVRIRKVPKRCVARNFKARVIVRDALGVSTSVFLDGRRIKRSPKRRFSVPIKARRLAAGRHRIRVVSRDAAGNRTVRRARFIRCARGISFTG